MKKAAGFFLLAFLVVSLSSASAADFPQKSIVLINPWSPGGGTDVVARMLAKELQPILGVSVVVVNKVGGSGAVGINEASKAAPDGYTLFINDKSFVSSHYMGVTKIRWDDMQPVCRLDAASHAIVIHKDAPWKSPQEFVADAKKRPGKIRIGVSGIGGMSHLNAENFKLASKIDVKMVSFEGSAQSRAALAGKHIDGMSAQLGEIKSFVDSGDFKILAVGDEKRHPVFPDAPTFKESGVDFTLNQWRAIWAPKGTPMEICQKIAGAVKKAMDTDDFKKLMANTMTQNLFLGPEELTAELKRQDQVLKKLVEDSGLLKK